MYMIYVTHAYAYASVYNCMYGKCFFFSLESLHRKCDHYICVSPLWNFSMAAITSAVAPQQWPCHRHERNNAPKWKKTANNLNCNMFSIREWMMSRHFVCTHNRLDFHFFSFFFFFSLRYELWAIIEMH